MKVNLQFTTVLTEVLAEVGRWPIPADVEIIGISLETSEEGAAVDQCQLAGIIGGHEFNFADAQAEFETPALPLIRASGNLAALAANAAGYMLVDVRGISELAVYAAAAANAAATGVLTALGQPANLGEITIGDVTYIFDTVLVDTPNHVDIGASASATLDNLIAAINAGAGAGTAYGTGTVQNPLVAAAVGDGDTVNLTARTAGSAGNTIPTTSATPNITLGATTLEDGAGPTSLVVAAQG